MSEAQGRNQGNQADFVLGTAEGWDAFGVVRWHGIEELSQPYRYEITLQRQASAGPVDLDSLLDSFATFRVASVGKWRTVHGILAEAEEIEQTRQIILYRVLLVPPFWRARHRRRCRNFVQKSLLDIVSAVLENRSPAHPEGLGGLTRYTSASAPDAQPDFSSFTAPTGSYRWDVKSWSRLENPRVRPYVVQYNESDFDFAARLLEDEGLSYSFEHAQDQVILAITDAPGVSPLFDPGATFTMRRLSASGQSHDQEIVRAFRDTRRLRSRGVMVREWDYLRSTGPLDAKDEEASPDPDLSRHFEFAVGEESVKVETGQHAATVRKQRYDAERALREGSSNVRTMEPGRRFTLHDGDGISPDLKLLAVRVETFATELTPQGTILDEEPFGFADAPGKLVAGDDCRFLALPEATPFRPAMQTPRPRIHGVQAAIVNAEEYPDGDRPVVDGGELAQVRVRFPWDQRPDTDDRSPTSPWIRVSQYWAGAGYGALYMPRAGHEVLVAYMQGDPDQPVIVGRVYNATHTPPIDVQNHPTQSTVKSQSAEEKKEVDGFNEIRFEDQAKKEQIYIHAQRNLDEVVLASHSTSVGGDQSNSVGHDQTESVQHNQKIRVKGNRDDGVLGELKTHVVGDEQHLIDASRIEDIGQDDSHFVGHTYFSKAPTTQFASTNFLSGGLEGGQSAKAQFQAVKFDVTGTEASFTETTAFVVKAGSAVLSMMPGCIVLSNGTGASVSLVGSSVAITGTVVTTDGAQVASRATGTNTVAGPTINLTGGSLINAVAGAIKLNG